MLRALAYQAWQANLVCLPIDSVAAVIESRMKRCATVKASAATQYTQRGALALITGFYEMGRM